MDCKSAFSLCLNTYGWKYCRCSLFLFFAIFERCIFAMPKRFIRTILLGQLTEFIFCFLFMRLLVLNLLLSMLYFLSLKQEKMMSLLSREVSLAWAKPKSVIVIFTEDNQDIPSPKNAFWEAFFQMLRCLGHSGPQKFAIRGDHNDS